MCIVYWYECMCIGVLRILEEEFRFFEFVIISGSKLLGGCLELIMDFKYK